MVRLARACALLVALLSVASVVTGCDSSFAGLHLRVAAGGPHGVYFTLAQPLADAWAGQMGIDRPVVLETEGSQDNLRRLRAGQADVAFSAADVAENNASLVPLRALARIYDDYLHVVVRADGPIRELAQLSGRRVSVGSPDSGVAVIAGRVLGLSHLTPGSVTHAGLDASADQLAKGRIDAFFWSGGLPTPRITELARATKIRLLDLTSVLPQIRRQYPVYDTAAITESVYHLGDRPVTTPVTTLVVPNFLVVPAAMPDDEAEALVRGFFDAGTQLVQANRAALAIDIRSAIDTAPVQLHPGALRYYRDAKV